LNNKDGELTEEEYREVIKYGRGMLINIIIGVVAAVVIAVYMGMLKKGVVFLMLLLPLRQYCGGYHMKNHNKCIVASIIIYFLQLMLIKNLKVTISVQIVMLIFALVIILMLAPVDNINNKMNDEYKKIIQKVVQTCFETEKLMNTNLYLNVILTNPETIRATNKHYREIDKETDVLSFPMFQKEELDKLVEESQTKKEIVEDVLGDIMISIQRVIEQANEIL